MAMFLSAILSDLTSRSVSFLMERYRERCSTPTVEERLQRLLLRVRVVVEEAAERRITSQAMLHRLDMMRKEMYRGYYTLYTLRCRANEEDKHQVSQSFAPSQLNSAKRVRLFRSTSSDEREHLQQVVGCLEAATEDASELAVLLSGCPRLYRQPYSMYLILDKCMFGRQIEMEHVVRFLLQAEAPGDENNPDVLPIIGPRKVGKSTLVEHACNDERVRHHFSQIVFLNLRNENMATPGDAVIKYENPASHGERVLVIVELDGDRFSRRLANENIDEGLWRRLHSPYIRAIPRGSKIIVTSRSDKIASYGTTSPLRLQFFDREAFWYFFKVRLFGSTDAAEHPKLASIAMEMAMELNGCFLTANIYSELLRSNVDARFWSSALIIIRELKQKNLFGGAHQVADFWEVPEPVYVPRMNKSSEDFVVLDDYETSSADHSAVTTTTTTVQEVLLGTARPQGKFDVLAWRSPIPPHFSYFLGCEIRRPHVKL
ncbi:putative disease resistance protein RGA1 [Phragmites australis]|uniref:putative disease resistance protein RGA1 n=1 Tax=Phragmites australis TaxID=29695 RepID=UPI002D79A1FD|nr:putative disease resistance protein RGA1 [Phragmites australis]